MPPTPRPPVAVPEQASRGVGRCDSRTWTLWSVPERPLSVNRSANRLTP